MKNKLFLWALIIFAFLMYFPKNVLAKEFGDQYKVKPGECMSVIGEKLGLDWQDLAQKNNIYAPHYQIIAGSILHTEGVAKSKLKKSVISKKEIRSEEINASENSTLKKTVAVESTSSQLQRKSEHAVDDAQLVLDEFQKNNRKDKAFQNVLKEFADNEAEVSVLESEIESGNVSWGYFRNHDKCDVAIDGQGAVHQGRINWKEGRDPEALEAAGVYRSPSGKQIWVFLKGGTICFKHKDSVEASLSRVEERRPEERMEASRQSTEGKFPERLSSLHKKEKSDELFDSAFLREEFGSSKSWKNDPNGRNVFLKKGDGASLRLPSIEGSVPSQKRVGFEDAVKGWAREGLFDASRRELDRTLWKANQPPHNASMEVMAKRVIQEMSSTSLLKEREKIIRDLREKGINI